MDGFLTNDLADVFSPQEYSYIVDNIKLRMRSYDFDEVALSSLIRASVDFVEHTPEPASCIFSLPNGNQYSVKVSNINFNFLYSLSLILFLKNVYTPKDIWFVLSILYVIADLFKRSIVKIDETSAIVIIAIYRLHHATEENIYEQTKFINTTNCVAIDKQSIKKALEELEKIKCIQLIDGEYKIIENVNSSLFDKF